MPRSCSTSIEKYLGDACGGSYLGKDIENSFAIPMLDQLIRRDIFLLNRDAFFEKYPPGWLYRKIVELGIPGGGGVLCDEELSIGGVMHLGQQTASFPEILFRLSEVLSGRVRFFMLFRAQSAFVRSFHTKLVAMGHFIPYSALVEQIRISDLAIHHLMHYADRLRDLAQYPYRVSTFEKFTEAPLDLLHHEILNSPVPSDAVFPHENANPDLSQLSDQVFARFERNQAQGKSVPVTLQTSNLYLSKQNQSVGIDRETFFEADPETEAWLAEMEATHFLPIKERF
jgi:hypothetical protein